MKKFNQGRDRNFGDRGSNRGSGGFDRNSNRRSERGGFGGANRGDTSMMHSAVCFECGKDCEVPFKPSGSKPVFCSICFGTKQDSERRSDDKFERNTSFKPRFDNDHKKEISNPKMDEIISRLDKIIKLLSPVVSAINEEPQLAKAKEVKLVETKKEVSKAPAKVSKSTKKKTTKAKK